MIQDTARVCFSPSLSLKSSPPFGFKLSASLSLSLSLVSLLSPILFPLYRKRTGSKNLYLLRKWIQQIESDRDEFECSHRLQSRLDLIAEIAFNRDLIGSHFHFSHRRICSYFLPTVVRRLPYALLPCSYAKIDALAAPLETPTDPSGVAHRRPACEQGLQHTDLSEKINFTL